MPDDKINNWLKGIRTVSLSILSVVLLLGSPARAASQKGLVTIGAISSPPRIDGELNDSCWKEAIEVAPFVLINQGEFAKEQTKVYLSYDKDNLYLGFRCEEVCLDPAHQQLASFKKDTLANDDDKIFSDDCLVILLDTDQDENTFFDVFINGAGAVNDARCSGNNPWGNRDKQWNSNARVSVRTDSGFWVAEVSMPFSCLNTFPREGNSWGVCLGRIEQNKKERSVWQPMQVGFHNAKEFGTAVFGKDLPGIRSVRMGSFKRGKNQLTAEILPQRSNTSIRIETTVTFAREITVRTFRDYTLSEKEQLSHDYVLDKDGTGSFQYRILNPVDLKTSYRSPLYSVDVKSAVLKASVTAESAYTLSVNGEETARETPLRKGENVIRVETEGQVKGEFSVGNFVFSLDDTWEREKNCYRKIILLDQSRFWPNWEKGGVSIAQNSIQQLFLVPEGIKGRTLTDYRFFLEVPEKFKVLSASSYYGALPVSCQEQGMVKRHKKNYRKYLITTPNPLTSRNIRAHQFISILVQLPVLKKGMVSDNTVFYYYLKADRGTIEEVPQALRVNILPPLKGKQPKKYVWLLSSNWLRNLDDTVCQEHLVRSFIAAGFNETSFAVSAVHLRKYAEIGLESWNLDCRPYLREHLDEALLDAEGLRRHVPGDALICTTLLLENSPAWAYMEKEIGEWVKRNKADRADWDYEASVWSSPISCYCPRCLEKFKEFAGISPAEEVTPGIIGKRHRKEWIRFMNMRMALLCARFRAAAKKTNPKIVFSVYSAYQSESARERYGIDWSMLADKTDLAMCGYGRPERELTDTLTVLGETPLVLGEIVYPCDVESQEYPAFASKATLLRRAADGTGGILIYSLTQLDGRTFYASAEISRLVAEYENLFVSHQKDNSLVTVSGLSPDDVVVFTNGETRLILLINETATKKKVGLINRKFSRRMKVFDYYREKELGNAEQINTEILPQDVKAFVITTPETKRGHH